MHVFVKSKPWGDWRVGAQSDPVSTSSFSFDYLIILACVN
jgi:hypothetical protein